MRRGHLRLSRALGGAPAQVGLGLRWEILDEVLGAIDRDGAVAGVDLFEIAPENYARRGGSIPAALERVASRVPITCHGLTLDVGGTRPLSSDELEALGALARTLGAKHYSDHFCFSSARGGHAHDLLPIPCIRGAAAHVARRLEEASSRLELPVVLENISHYARLGVTEVDEAEFIGEVLDRADAGLLLDVNNIYVNAQNDGFDPLDFLTRLPLDRTTQIHVAGHQRSDELGLVIDTHGAEIIDPVYELLEEAVRRVGPVPVVLERDHRVPRLSVLLDELGRVREVVERALVGRAAPQAGGEHDG